MGAFAGAPAMAPTAVLETFDDCRQRAVNNHTGLPHLPILLGVREPIVCTHR
jgi:hypothetical protein